MISKPSGMTFNVTVMVSAGCVAFVIHLGSVYHRLRGAFGGLAFANGNAVIFGVDVGLL